MGHEAGVEVENMIKEMNDKAGQHSRASDAIRLCSTGQKQKQVSVPLLPKHIDDLYLAHDIDYLKKIRKNPPQPQPAPHPANSLHSSNSSTHPSQHHSSASTQQSPRGQPAQPAQSAPAQPSPRGQPAQPVSAQQSPQGQSVQMASLKGSTSVVQGQSGRPPNPLQPPQRQQQQQQQQEEEGSLNPHQQQHRTRMQQEANLWPRARLEEALALQTLAFVPEMGPGNNISASNQVENLADVVESAEDGHDADAAANAEAPANAEGATVEDSPFGKLKKWLRKSHSK
ncbi:hypothetical protein TrVGV298_007461 [Trichoderma virens]|nr:hypothetical protein TrVGV298_007461 [Trichoderma virens]